MTLFCLHEVLKSPMCCRLLAMFKIIVTVEKHIKYIKLCGSHVFQHIKYISIFFVAGHLVTISDKLYQFSQLFSQEKTCLQKGNWPCPLVSMFFYGSIFLAIFVAGHPLTISAKYFEF